MSDPFQLVRRSAELLSRGRTLRRSIYVNNQRLPLIVTPDAQLKYAKLGRNAFDEELIDLAERFVSKDSVVWDIGANVGVFTFAAAAVAESGTVVSVEADSWLASIIRRTARFPAYAGRDIRVIPAAVSNDLSISEFMIAQRGRASNALQKAHGRTTMGGVRELQYVPTVSLDKMAQTFPPPDLVKVDVEGAEHFVFQGATGLLAQQRPVFYAEIGVENRREIYHLLRRHDYIILNQDGTAISSAKIPAFNVYLTPTEKSAWILQRIRANRQTRA